ncbi:MAG: tRNA (N6-isopentenyl adenosine(37)-C2)-methylthiotransferase MiaB, partial [Roseiarcus sp.]
MLEDADGIASPARESHPRAFIKSFGCQMNVYDSERMGDLAAEAGYHEAMCVEDA